MGQTLLQEMIVGLSYGNLPPNWSQFDLYAFSRKKKLWGYQRNALESAIAVLWKYYEDFVDYQPREAVTSNDERKRRLYQWYAQNEIPKGLDIPLSRIRRDIQQVLEPFYETIEGSIPYQNFINRMCFWMATGSGKTLVIVKLIEVLRGLILTGEIPANDLLVLTHRDDLIEQLKTHINEFNANHSDFHIRLRELKEFDSIKRESPSLFRGREVLVFFYRSDNLSDEQKEKILDFHNYDNNGKWYVLLDEAHKGDKEDSKRQHIYSILSRNGFLFNFSATFTDLRDITTTVYDFNLARFIEAGYGKHITILAQEFRAFSDDDDYSGDEKQKIVLKSLIMLVYAIKRANRIRRLRPDMYHRPMLLTLVNSVNTEDADLKLFFRELERVAKGEITGDVWEQAKNELIDEFKDHPPLMFEADSVVNVNQNELHAMQVKDILQYAYNAATTGEIEVLARPSNRQELVLKLKTSNKPFALVKIGDISGWLKDELAGYELSERYEEEGYFESLNKPASDVNILMGSRSFYEGWDSNRPNVVNFINIGVGSDAKKFILQAVGRGVRIEPLKDSRQRLNTLYTTGEVSEELYAQLKDEIDPLETLVVFGTNRDTLHKVIEHLDQEAHKGDWQNLDLFRLSEGAQKHRLLIPIYREADQTLAEVREPAKFEIRAKELDLLSDYVNYLDDDRLMIAAYDTEPKLVSFLRASLKNRTAYYAAEGREFKNLDIMMRRVLAHFGTIPYEFERLKTLIDEIRHYRNISVSIKDFKELKDVVEAVRNFKDPTATERELDDQMDKGKITRAQYKEGIRSLAKQTSEKQYEYEGRKITIKHLANHYYLPLVLTQDEKVDYIKHVIRTPSETHFINDLSEYIAGTNLFDGFDWWMFSKLDESLDTVYIPYYDAAANRMREFKPDFIFWLQKGNDYHIAFVDPKGIEHADYQRKIDGYQRLFELNGQPRSLSHKGLSVTVSVYLYSRESFKVAQGYRNYWVDSIDGILRREGGQE